MRPITTSLLVILLLLSACSQPAALQPTPVPPTATPPTPSATPDPYRRFIQQLDSARSDGYLPASYASDPGGAPLLLAGLDLALVRESGLLPLSPDGLELGRIDGEQLVLPRLEAIPYRNSATGELSIYTFSNTDGAWNYYTNHSGPTLKVPAKLPADLADLVGVYNAPDKDPALVAAKLMPDGSIKLIPIVFTEDENMAFGAQSVFKDGQEVFYNQFTSAWESLPTPTPDVQATSDKALSEFEVRPGEKEKLTLYSESCFSGMDIKEEYKTQAWKDFLAPIQAYFNRQWRAALDMPSDQAGIIKWLQENDYKTPMMVKNSKGEEVWFKILQGNNSPSKWTPGVRKELAGMQINWEKPQVWIVAAMAYQNHPACQAKLAELEEINGNLGKTIGYSGRSFKGDSGYAEGLLFDQEGSPILLMMNPQSNQYSTQAKYYQFGDASGEPRYSRESDAVVATAMFKNWVESNIKFNRDNFGDASYTRLHSWTTPGCGDCYAFWVQDVTDKNNIFVPTGK